MPFFITDDGVCLYYQISGEGPTFVLLHELTASSRHFQKQIPALAEHCQVIVPDLRGQGQSEASSDHLTLKSVGFGFKTAYARVEDRKSIFDWLVYGRACYF